MELPSPKGGLQRTGTGFVFTQAFLLQMAQQARADLPVATWLYECDVFLFTNSLQPTGLSVYADLVKPTWTGWALSIDKEWLVGSLSPAGIEWQCTTLAQWTVGADPDDQVAGWGLVQGANLIGAELYDDPISVTADEVIGFIPTMSLAPQ
jgi:hypothetical protein